MAVDAYVAPRRVVRPLGCTADRQLTQGVRAGDRADFEAIYHRYHHALLVFCAQLLGSRDDAEDAVQYVFTSAYGALRNGTTEIALKPWRYAIARNRCRSLLRS